MLKKTVKTISFAMSLAMAATLFSAAPVMAASKKPKLLKSVETLEYDDSTKTWKSSSLTEYSYNKKGDPIEIRFTSFTGYGHATRTISYTYRKNGKRKYAKYKQNGTEWVGFGGDSYYADYKKTGKISYNKRGIRTRDKYKKYTYNEDGEISSKNTGSEIYKYKKRGFHTTERDREFTKFKVKSRKNGILKKILEKNTIENKWTVRETFNAKGLIKKYRGSKVKYTYGKKTGLVRIVRAKYAMNERYKFILKYTEKSTNKVKYATMINSVVDSNFIWN